MLAEELRRAKTVLNLGFYLENDMQESANGGGTTNALLAIVLGGLVNVVAALGFLMFNDHPGARWHDRLFDRGGITTIH